jgi:flavin reductase (DIM6/NTAB) family NADH-FMN oxidoreductase RutF
VRLGSRRTLKVIAPLIAECYANFECKLVDGSRPETIHYRGEGVFMVSGRTRSYRRRFKSVNL